MSAATSLIVLSLAIGLYSHFSGDSLLPTSTSQLSETVSHQREAAGLVLPDRCSVEGACVLLDESAFRELVEQDVLSQASVDLIKVKFASLPDGISFKQRSEVPGQGKADDDEQPAVSGSPSTIDDGADNDGHETPVDTPTGDAACPTCPPCPVCDETHATNAASRVAGADEVAGDDGKATPEPAFDNEAEAAEFTAMNLVTANILYGTSCGLLSIAYGVLLYFFRRDTKAQVVETMVYHFVFHKIAQMMALSVLSRPLAAILYVCCCLMPTLCTGLALLNPVAGEQQRLLWVMFTSYPQRPASVHAVVSSWSSYAWNVLHLLCALPLATSMIYIKYLQIDFVGIYGVFTGSAFVFLLSLTLRTETIPWLNRLFQLLPQVAGLELGRYLYVANLYWVLLLVVARVDGTSGALRTVCYVSALNVFWWALPLFLLCVVIRPEMNYDPPPTDNIRNNFMEVLDSCLQLIQQPGNIRYKLFITLTIAINVFLLRVAVYYQSWIPLPYAVGSLCLLSFTVPANAGSWSTFVHVPIAVCLFQACFAYVSIVDDVTVQSLSWLGPQQAIIWIVTTVLRTFTAGAAVLQASRALTWLTIHPRHWTGPTLPREALLFQNEFVAITIHTLTLYLLNITLLVFVKIEPNYWISLLIFEFSAIVYGCYTISSLHVILRKVGVGGGQDPGPTISMVTFCVTHIMSLRLHIAASGAFLPRMFSFVASLLSFSNFQAQPILGCTIAVLSYGRFGLYYNSELLIFSAVITFFAVVALFVHGATNSKRATLICVSICAIGLIFLGFDFQQGNWNTDTNKAEFIGGGYEHFVEEYLFYSLSTMVDGLMATAV